MEEMKNVALHDLPVVHEPPHFFGSGAQFFCAHDKRADRLQMG